MFRWEELVQDTGAACCAAIHSSPQQSNGFAFEINLDGPFYDLGCEKLLFYPSPWSFTDDESLAKALAEPEDAKLNSFMKAATACFHTPDRHAESVAVLNNTSQFCQARTRIADDQGTGVSSANSLQPACSHQRSLDWPPKPHNEPVRRARALCGDWIGDHLDQAATPHFKTAVAVSHTMHGTREAGLRGAVLRFDDGRTKPRLHSGDPEWGALNTLAWGQRHDLAFVTIARNGTIFLPANFDWQIWGVHVSANRAPEIAGFDLNSTCVGIEINGPAQLFPTTDMNCFVPWFNAVRDEHGNVRLNIYGEARCLDRRDEWYTRDQVKIVSSQRQSLRPGVYAPMTIEQDLSLRTLLIWLKRTFPSTFQFDHVYAASEIRPDLRNGEDFFALFKAGQMSPQPVTMSDFRFELKKEWSAQQALMAKSYFSAIDY